MPKRFPESHAEPSRQEAAEQTARNDAAHKSWHIVNAHDAPQAYEHSEECTAHETPGNSDSVVARFGVGGHLISEPT